MTSIYHESRTTQRTLWLNKFSGFRIRLTQVRQGSRRPKIGTIVNHSFEVQEVDSERRPTGPYYTACFKESIEERSFSLWMWLLLVHNFDPLLIERIKLIAKDLQAQAEERFHRPSKPSERHWK